MKLTLIAGPCTLENEAMAKTVALALKQSCSDLGVEFLFKASFDKANRTLHTSARGPGLQVGLAQLAAIAQGCSVRTTTDVHEVSQCEVVGEVVDVIQIPAFLCRQTDLLLAAGRTGKIVNIKKGQFLAPYLMKHAVEKARAGGAKEVWVTERGTSFGHGDLVVDFRGFSEMRPHCDRLIFDGTHSSQRPSGGVTGGHRQDAMALIRAAIAVGVDGIFCEVHPNPESALSDSQTQLPLNMLHELLPSWQALHQVSRQFV